MKPSEALSANRAAIRRVVKSHRASNARVFGSAMRGEDSEHSDLDILVDPTTETTLFDIGAIRRELRKALAHGYFRVDLEIVWKTIQNDLATLRRQINAIVKGLSAA
jgi:predicted nucleotidyltransferase